MLVSGTTARTRRKATGTRSFVSNRAPDMNQHVQPAEKVFLVQKDKKTKRQKDKKVKMTKKDKETNSQKDKMAKDKRATLHKYILWFWCNIS